MTSTEMRRAKRRPAPRLRLIDAALAIGVVALTVFASSKNCDQVGRAVSNPGPDRGRWAVSPGKIPLRGWKEVLLRTWREFNEDNITIIAGGVTFSILLAIFPALGAFVALYGLVGNIDDVPRQIQVLGVLLPPDMLKFVGGEMVRLARARSGGLSIALIIGLVISFWSANGATKALMVGLNVAYEEREKRGFFRCTATSLLLTLGLLVFAAATVVALGAGSVVSAFLGEGVGRVIDLARWPLLVVAFAGCLAVFYRFGPSREMARWRWITWGSAAATTLWLLASLAFSFYVGRFAHYDRTYGSLGTVIGLMVWIWLSALIVLLGAEMNAELEHQTAVDSTTGRPLPMGARGAKMADSVAQT